MVVGVKPKPFFTGSNVTLLRVSAVGGILVCTAGFIFKKLIERRFRTSEFYQAAVTHALAYPALVNYLGEPISFGNVDISQAGKNYALATSASCQVPIRGSRNGGKLSFVAVRNEMTQDDRVSNQTDIDTESKSTNTKYDADCVYCQPTVTLSPWEIQYMEVTIDNRPNERVIVPTFKK